MQWLFLPYSLPHEGSTAFFFAMRFRNLRGYGWHPKIRAAVAFWQPARAAQVDNLTVLAWYK
jgi:hypothetical protein